MRSRKVLAAAAIAAGALAVGGWLLGAAIHRTIAVETGETRAAAERILAGITESRKPASDAELLAAARAAAGERPVVALWVLDTDGTILLDTSPAHRTGTAEERATVDAKAMLAALPDDALSTEQRTLLLIVSAIRSEGEHNDVFAHLVRPLNAADGSLAGYVGAAYDKSPESGHPSVAWMLLTISTVLLFLFYWIALPAWTFLDARDRGERAWAWAAFVLVGNLVAVLAYLLSRPPTAPRTAARPG